MTKIDGIWQTLLLLPKCITAGAITNMLLTVTK